jgi:hypothetical protein
MKTQIRTSFGLALLLAMGILATMLALGMFSSVKPLPVSAGNQVWTFPAGVVTISSPVSGVTVANDGTIFAIADLAGGGVVTDAVATSANSGTSFTLAAAQQPAAGVIIVDVAASPNFTTDRDLYAVGTNGSLYLSGDAGVTWALVTAAPAANVGDIGVALDISPNYNAGTGVVAVALRDGLGASGAARGLVYTVTFTAAVAGATTVLGAADDTAGTAASLDNAALDVSFSPEFQSDGRIMVIYQQVAGGVVGDTDCATLGTVCEIRYNGTGITSGQDLPTPLVTAGIGAAGSAVANSIEAQIAFPSDFSVATSDNYWVAVGDSTGTMAEAAIGTTAGAGFFRRTQRSWGAAGTTATTGTPPVGTSGWGSIAASGTFNAGTVFLGSTAGNGSTIIVSTTGGQTFAATAITLGGASGNVNVAIHPDFANTPTVVAATEGANGGISVSTTGGATTAAWVQRGLYNDTYAATALDFLSMDISPNFNTDNTAFLVMVDSAAGTPTNAVFRSTTARTGVWEKVATSPAGVDSVGVSANYATDTTVYIADGATGVVAKSSTSGGSFVATAAAAIPLNANQRLVVPNSTTVHAQGTLGRVASTVNSGVTWTSATAVTSGAITDLKASPAYATDTTLLAGAILAAGSAVAISTDAGATWTVLGVAADTTAATNVVVAFDSNYATTKMIYLGTNPTGDVYRWEVGTSTVWLDLNAGNIVSGASAVPTLAAQVSTISGLASVGGILYGSSSVAAFGVTRSLTPNAAYDASGATWWDLQWGPAGTGGAAGVTTATGLSDGGSDKLDQAYAAAALVVRPSLFAVAPGSGQIYAVDTATPSLMSYTDNLTVAVVLSTPADDADLTAHPIGTWTAYPNTITAAATDDGLRYQVQVSADATYDTLSNTFMWDGTGGAGGDLGALSQSLATTATFLSPVFTAGTIYYWRVRAVYDSLAGAGVTADVVSPWSESRNYNATAGVASMGLLYPVSAPGLRLEVPSLTPGMNWTIVAGAVDYRVQIAVNPSIVSAGGSYVSPVISRTVGSATPALQLGANDLQSGTIYYWQVQAIFTNSVLGLYTNLGPGGLGNSGVFNTPAAGAVVTSAVVSTAPAVVLAEAITADASLIVWSYAGQVWASFNAALAAGHPANDLSVIQAGDGVWLYNSTAADITVTILGRSVTLNPGWNLKGL